MKLSRFVKNLRKVKNEIEDLEIRVLDVQDRMYDLLGKVEIMYDRLEQSMNDARDSNVRVKDVQNQIYDIKVRTHDSQDRVYDNLYNNIDSNIRLKDIQDRTYDNIGNIVDTNVRVRDIQDRAYDLVFNLTNNSYQNSNIQYDDKYVFLKQNALPAFVETDEITTNSFKVMQRALKLKINKNDCYNPESSWQKIYENFPDVIGSKTEVIFNGKKTSELNKFINDNNDVLICINNQLLVDEMINLKTDVSLDFNNVELDIGKSIKHVVYGDGVNNITISGINISGGINGILLQECSNIRVMESNISECKKRPLMVINSKNVHIFKNAVTNNGNGGILVCDDSESIIIENNEIYDNYGTSNWMAGLVISGLELDNCDIDQLFDDNLHFPKELLSIEKVLKAPHNVLVYDNLIQGNNSSGVYIEGGYYCYIVDNNIRDNDKEGMCLDYGTIGTYVYRNDIAGNGSRARQSNEDLNMDFVGVFGRLPDGSAAAKLPGISIDNSQWNIISENKIYENAGSGIKCVRTGIENVICMNNLNNNNSGQSDDFHFFGIELGAALSDLDEDSTLDFEADFDNIVSKNIINGNHYADIYLAKDCENNIITENICFGTNNNSIEDFSESNNVIGNNIFRR